MEVRILPGEGGDRSLSSLGQAGARKAYTLVEMTRACAVRGRIPAPHSAQEQTCLKVVILKVWSGDPWGPEALRKSTGSILFSL